MNLVKSMIVSLILAAVPHAEAVTVNLSPGWNLVSPVLAQAKAVDQFLTEHASGCSITKIWEYSGGWAQYVPSGINQINTIKPGQGYWFLVSGACDVTTNDTTPGYAYSFESSGWKLIGSNSQSDVSIDSAGLLNPANFSSGDASSVQKIWEYSGSSGWKSWQPSGASALSAMRPGYGYWMLLSTGGISLDSSNSSLADLLPPVCPGCPPIQ